MKRETLSFRISNYIDMFVKGTVFAESERKTLHGNNKNSKHLVQECVAFYTYLMCARQNSILYTQINLMAFVTRFFFH